MKLSVRVSREDMQGISATRLYRIGLRAARENPGLISFIKVQHKETVTTSIVITQAEYLHMQWLGLRARETIQLGISQCAAPPRSWSCS